MYAADDSEALAFSWYSGWEDIEPFWAELVPDREARVLLPGVGNDAAMVGLYDAGWERLTAFDYAVEGVERSRVLFGERSVDLLHADATCLEFAADGSFDATLEKGALDAICIAGGDSLRKAVDELARVVRPGGVVVSITGFSDKISAVFADEEVWRCVRDGSIHITEEGYATNQINAFFMAWERVGGVSLSGGEV